MSVAEVVFPSVVEEAGGTGSDLVAMPEDEEVVSVAAGFVVSCVEVFVFCAVVELVEDEAAGAAEDVAAGIDFVEAGVDKEDDDGATMDVDPSWSDF